MLKNQLLFGVGVLVLAGFGCNPVQMMIEKAAESEIESQTGGNSDINFDDNSYTYTDESGNVISYGNDIDLPADFPAGVILPDDAQIMAYATGIQQGMDASVSFISMKSLDDLEGWYKLALEDAGWTETTTYDGVDSVVKVYSDSSGKTFSLSLNVTEEGTTGVVILGSQN